MDNWGFKTMIRNLLLVVVAILSLTECKTSVEQKVMARAVPERSDDFVFENDLIAGRFYGKALEGNPTSPGLDVWVKLPGRLVADEWYAGALVDKGYYHHNHGGKDCYKVSVSLGGGASVPFINGKLCYPATNYRSFVFLKKTPEEVAFTLHYPSWEAADGISVILDKKVVVSAGSYFIKVEDTYSFKGTEKMDVAVGMKLHGKQKTVQEKIEASDRLAIWEKASDQSFEPEDGFIGVAIVMPHADSLSFSEELDHGLLFKTVTSGQTISYKVGSCWSKADIKDSDKWFEMVRTLE